MPLPTAGYLCSAPTDPAPLGRGGATYTPFAATRDGRRGVAAYPSSPEIVVGNRAYWAATAGAGTALLPGPVRFDVEFGVLESPTGYGGAGRPLRLPRAVLIESGSVEMTALAAAVGPLLDRGVSVYGCSPSSFVVGSGFLPLAGGRAATSGTVSGATQTSPRVRFVDDNLTLTPADPAGLAGGDVLCYVSPQLEVVAISGPGQLEQIGEVGDGWQAVTIPGRSSNGTPGNFVWAAHTQRVAHGCGLVKSYLPPLCRRFAVRSASGLSGPGEPFAALAVTTAGCGPDVIAGAFVGGDGVRDFSPERQAAAAARIVADALAFFAD